MLYWVLLKCTENYWNAQRFSEMQPRISKMHSEFLKYTEILWKPRISVMHWAGVDSSINKGLNINRNGVHPEIKLKDARLKEIVHTSLSNNSTYLVVHNTILQKADHWTTSILTNANKQWMKLRWIGILFKF